MGSIDETACAMLCLLTRAAASKEDELPLTRPQVRRMIEIGALTGLVLRDVEGMDPALMARARSLLGRVRAVYDCIRVYEASGYRLMTPEHPAWPRALERMGAHMPLFLFAWGNEALLDAPRVAVAGSRRILPETKRAAEQTGRQLAQEGYVVVTGGAVGADSAAQRAAWQAGGGVILVPALAASRMMGDARARAAVTEERVLILCDALPDEPFSAAKALSRNHTIYALGQAALVIASRRERGGSWHGATDCMRGGYAPVFVWDGRNEDTEGNRALEELGARTFSLYGRETLSEQLKVI